MEHKTYNRDEYIKLISDRYELTNNTYDYILEFFENRNIRTIYIQPHIKPTRVELINLVLTFQEQLRFEDRYTELRDKDELTKEELIEFNNMKNNYIERDDLLYHVLYNLYIKMVMRVSSRYTGYGIVYKTQTNQEKDYHQEAFIIMMKCCRNFKVYEDRVSSFTSYYQGELQNHFIETTRMKYFEVMKTPVSVYRMQRKEAIQSMDTDKAPVRHAIVNDMMREVFVNVQKNGVYDLTEEEIVQGIDNSPKIIKKIMDLGILTNMQILLICLNLGIGCQGYTYTEMSLILKASNSSVAKKCKEARRKLEDCKEFHAFLRECSY